jgi:hypothetical protein
MVFIGQVHQWTEVAASGSIDLLEVASLLNCLTAQPWDGRSGAAMPAH